MKEKTPIESSRKFSLATAVLVVLITSQATSAFGGEQVSNAAYGDDWPFPFQIAELICDPPGNSIVLKTDVKTYALNGRALGQMDKRGYLDSRRLMSRDAGGSFENGVNTVSTLIQRGMRLCN